MKSAQRYKPLITNLIFGLFILVLGVILAIRGWAYSKDGSYIEESFRIRIYGCAAAISGFFLVRNYFIKYKKYRVLRHKEHQK